MYIYTRQVYYLYLIECRELKPSIFLIKDTKGLRSVETIINEKSYMIPTSVTAGQPTETNG